VAWHKVAGAFHVAGRLRDNALPDAPAKQGWRRRRLKAQHSRAMQNTLRDLLRIKTPFSSGGNSGFHCGIDCHLLLNKKADFGATKQQRN
jgi:hypothetical protein